MIQVTQPWHMCMEWHHMTVLIFSVLSLVCLSVPCTIWTTMWNSMACINPWPRKPPSRYRWDFASEVTTVMGFNRKSLTHWTSIQRRWLSFVYLGSLFFLIGLKMNSALPAAFAWVVVGNAILLGILSFYLGVLGNLQCSRAYIWQITYRDKSRWGLGKAYDSHLKQFSMLY